MLNISEEVTEVMSYADDFLSPYAFFFVLIGLSGVFWFSYILAFLQQSDYSSHIFIVSGIIYYMLLPLSIMLSAAAANEAAEMVKSTVKLMGSWIPKPYRDSDMYLRQRLKPRVEMTLWKMYKVDKSLFINSLGTLLTYGMLLGTLGSAQNQNDMPRHGCMK
ncbi:hypothetical protein AVEN_211576-1 [Araneus ventricosus]|uniref:Uncharacterized protein n=1 Tax=Araneus ventricosus TaxID=182803 RepID=A0A4Y2D9Z7_ARAVE|nr:hypothetical protein AVEN_211576-1 [Araneus ventricosus]